MSGTFGKVVTKEQVVVMIIQKQIANLPQEQQAAVGAVAGQIRAVWKDADAKEPGIGTIALALVAAEAGAEE